MKKEERWGHKWLPGMRVRMYDSLSPRRGERDGVIKDRSRGQKKGKSIWWFTVLFDGDAAGTGRVYGPGEIVVGIEAALSRASPRGAV